MPRTSTSGVPAFVDYLNSLPSEVALPSVDGTPISQFFSGSFAKGTALQLSSSQVAVEFASGSVTDYLLVEGTGLSLPLSSLNGTINLGDATGTVTSADVYSGGTFSNGAVTGGTKVGTLTFSPTQYQISAGGDSITLTGTNLPTTAGVVESIAAGTYSGPALTISGLQAVDGSLTLTLSLSAGALSLSVGNYEITLSGTFPTSLTAAQVNDLATHMDPGLSAYVTGVTVTDTATNTVVESATSTVQGGVSIAGVGSFESHGVANWVDDLLGLVGGAAARDDLLGKGVAQYLIESTSGAVVVGDLSSWSTVYTQVGALGSEWTIEGADDFLGDGHAQFIMESSSGAVDLGDVGSNGKATYTQIASIGPEWSFEGVGDFLGEGHAQFLIESTSGAVDIGDVGSNGKATYTQVGALGKEWTFVGVGDFLGLGHDQFLIESSSGAVDVADVEGGKASYTQVAALGSEWKFVGAGDFEGEGHAQFLIESTSGAVVVGDVGANGKATYTQVAAIGPEWKFVGAGAYYPGGGAAAFMIESTSGAVDLGSVSGSQTYFNQVSSIGSEWKFHS